MFYEPPLQLAEVPRRLYEASLQLAEVPRGLYEVPLHLAEVPRKFYEPALQVVVGVLENAMERCDFFWSVWETQLQKTVCGDNGLPSDGLPLSRIVKSFSVAWRRCFSVVCFLLKIAKTVSLQENPRESFLHRFLRQDSCFVPVLFICNILVER